MRLAVIGIGQSLRGDDAAGLEAVRLWQDTHSATAANAEIRVELAESPGLELLDLLATTESAVLVDAICSGAEPGSLHHLAPDALSHLFQAPGSAHSWGIAEVLRLATTLDPHAKRRPIRLLGIETAQMELGAGLSPAVRACLPLASDAIQDHVTELLAR